MPSRIVPLEPIDQDRVKAITIKEWSSEKVVIHGMVFYPHLLPGFKAVEEDDLTGLITYNVKDKDCEIITLNSFKQGAGIGSSLMKAVEEAAKKRGCLSCSLVTTNNNLNALGFYQKHGYCITEVRPGAVDESRKLKPSIPLVDENGIPIRDEITLKKQIV
jgi:GNAT superfamily N-acetyltransferase